MRTFSLTISVCFIFLAWQFLISAELLKAETVSGDAKETATNSAGRCPAIFFESSDFDFGKIYKGQKVEHVYKVENRGYDILKIEKVKPSCGCTAIILTDSLIPPGKAGEIKATFNSGSYSGKVMKSITVFSNDQDTPVHKLTFSGEIIEDISVKPRNIDFGSVSSGKIAEKTATITSETGHDFKINKITPSSPFIDTSITEEEDGKYIVKATLKDNLKIGRFSGQIFLETNSLRQPKTSIPFFGEIVGDISVYPQRIYYGTVTEGKELTQKVFVKIHENGIKILSTKLIPDYLSAKIDERYNNNNPHCMIEITLHKEAVAGKLNGLLELYTNSKNQPVVKIPIVGEIRKG